MKSPPQRVKHIYRLMLDRCSNPKSQAFAGYGGRGIYVCSRWQAGIQYFIEDMGLPPDGLTLERVDNNAGYSKANCKWATRKEQARNRRSSRRVAVGATQITLAELEEKVGLPGWRVGERLKRGWTLEDSISVPAGGRRRARPVCGCDHSGETRGYGHAKNGKTRLLCCTCGRTFVLGKTRAWNPRAEIERETLQ